MLLLLNRQKICARAGMKYVHEYTIFNAVMLIYESYEEHERHLPSDGKFIIAQFNAAHVVVYQAFNDRIAEYALKHQKFGGDSYDFNRTTWLKPSFLWMMYYSGWANKQNQENVLAITISKEGFEEMLQHAVYTMNDGKLYKIGNVWREGHADNDVLLQWEAYHDLHGNKTDRKAVKIGLAGKMMQRYNNEWIQRIENITDYVKAQQQLVLDKKIKDVMLPAERAYAPDDLRTLKYIDATTISL